MYGGMNNTIKNKKICAIYTRKSTDERLDMEFNTLDAQREGCEAYILSQKSEGWAVSPDQYDDGGYSGGSLERPALNRMMEDIKAGKINIVVVYKIDRLTRSLADFSKLVEIFDQYGVTFVSITQSFNTTTSMGRLTLNVLLSFAQFEREVTGERIRDKIAASKAKGMWMGGSAPLGYKIENRRLIQNEDEVPLANHIFDRYLFFRNVRELKNELDREGIKTPIRTSKKGNLKGGFSFSRGNLYAILRNPVYLGQISHKDIVYDGLHEGIIEPEKWQRVQDLLTSNSIERTEQATQRSILQGLLFNMDGIIYSPTYTSKKGKRYSYYISQNLLQYKDHPKGLIARIPSHEIESFVEKHIRREIPTLCGEAEPDVLNYIMAQQSKMSAHDLIRSVLEKVVIDMEQLTLHLKGSGFKNLVKEKLDIMIGECDDYSVMVPFMPVRARDGIILIQSNEEMKKGLFDKPDHELKLLVQGVVWRDMHFDGMSLKDIAKKEGLSDSHVGKIIFQSFNIMMSIN